MGRVVHYEWRAEAPREGNVVVFLHDGLGSVRSWKKVPQAICRRVGLAALLYDRMGYGRSGPPPEFGSDYLERESGRLHDLLDHLGLDRVHLVGHSDGASIALLFAADFPDRVRSVTAAATHTFVEPVTIEGVRATFEELSADLPRWLVRHQAEAARALLEGWAAEWLSQSRARWDVRHRLADICCPLLVIQGRDDEYATLAQVDAIRRAVPSCESWIVPDCGHSPHVEVPEEFVERVARFLIECGTAMPARDS